MKKKGARVAVGLSGGVDSAVSAALLVEQGYRVKGVHLECWSQPGCSVSQDRKDALAVALNLGIPFKVLDFEKEYRKKVIDYFYSEYKAGRTPNPDVVCNREIKFGLFLKWAVKEGFDYIGTGHYARTKIKNQKSKIKDSEYLLLRGIDVNKDQSYFLYQLNQEQLGRVLFPVGGMTKEEVRAEARKRKLCVAEKPDSTGICFVGEVDVREFLKKKIKEKKGEVVMMEPHYATATSRRLPIRPFRDSVALRGDKRDGKSVSRLSRSVDEYVVVGEHKGVWFYTIGQRHGFTINKSKIKNQNAKLRNDLPPLFVVGKDIASNRLIVGERQEAMSREFEVGDLHFINPRYYIPDTKYQKLSVRIRHQGVLSSCELEVLNGQAKVRLAEPVFGVAPGQAAVFYDGEVCLGGGTIK